MSHDHTSLLARLAVVSLAAVTFAVPQFISVSSWAVSSPAPAATASPSGATSQSASPASDAVAKAQAQLDAANTKLDEATKNLTAAQVARDKAAAQSNVSAQGFFTWLATEPKQDADAVTDAKQAVRVLNGEVDGIENAYAATEIGAKSDATSIDNVKSAVKLIRTANTLRAADGLDPLKINSALMASAQVNANARQAKPTQEIDDYLGLGWKENASSGQSDPLDGWYTQQKKLWDAGDKDSEKTVNYRNLTDPTLTLTGLGLNTAGDKARAPISSSSTQRPCSTATTSTPIRPSWTSTLPRQCRSLPICRPRLTPPRPPSLLRRRTSQTPRRPWRTPGAMPTRNPVRTNRPPPPPRLRASPRPRTRRPRPIRPRPRVSRP